MPLVVSTNNKLYPSLALETLRVAAGDISYQIKTNDYGIEWVRIPQYKLIETNFDGSVYNAYWNKFNRVRAQDIANNELFNGAIVVIGTTFQGSQQISTPVGKMYPHEVQANLIKTMIDGITIKRPDYFYLAEITSLLILGLLVLALLRWSNVVFAGIGSVLLIGGVAVTSWQLFYSSYLLFNPTWIIISLYISI